MTGPGSLSLHQQVRACSLCAGLPLGPRPIFQASATSKVLIASQAPGRKAHASGWPFDDASGDRLRDWLGLDRESFYDASRVAILPMGLCYPGKTGSGDAAPRSECGPKWRGRLLEQLGDIRLTLAIGKHAMAWHLPGFDGRVTDAVRDWRRWWPGVVPMVHPSPRNNGWLRANPWFERDVIPAVRRQVAELLALT